MTAAVNGVWYQVAPWLPGEHPASMEPAEFGDLVGRLHLALDGDPGCDELFREIGDDLRCWTPRREEIVAALGS